MEVKNIGILGRRNVGKSSLINLLLGEDFAIVSDTPGTTTDPIKKRMEIPNLGVIQLIDTAGIDDYGNVGEKRVEKSLKTIKEIDLAILIFTNNTFAKEEKDILLLLKKYNVPTILLHNQSDIIELNPSVASDLNSLYKCDVLEFSCCYLNKEQLKNSLDLLISFMIKGFAQKDEPLPILHNLVEPNDSIVLVCPIDSEAPKNRLILPQVMAIRDILDNNGVVTTLQPEQLSKYINSPQGENIKLVVTDSQVFKQVAAILPPTTPLTSFSILMARSKGPFLTYIEGCKKIPLLKAGDKILILESCKHHSTCEDIGRVKIPMMLKKFINSQNGGSKDVKDIDLQITFISGLDTLPNRLDEYALAIQCGGCMVTRKQLCNRVNEVIEAGVPITNYGMAIAYFSGIFNRALEIFEDK